MEQIDSRKKICCSVIRQNKQTTMASTSGSVTSRSIIPSLVRFLSTVHAVRKDKKIAEFAWSTAFSRRHFPKTLATTCLLSFGVGFHGMHRCQQNRQWKWEQEQERLENQYYNNNMIDNDSKLSTKVSVNTASI